MVDITNNNGQTHQYTSKRKRIIQSTLMLLKILTKLHIIYNLVRTKMDLSLNQINALYYQLISISVILNKFCIQKLLGNGNLASSAMQTTIASTVPVITMSYLEHVVSKQKLSVSKANIKNMILGAGKTSMIASSLHTSIAGVVHKDAYSVLNQALLPLFGHGQHLDKLENYVKILINTAITAFILDVMQDTVKITPKSIKKGLITVIDKVFTKRTTKTFKKNRST